jgi:hypothetical protein
VASRPLSSDSRPLSYGRCDGDLIITADDHRRLAITAAGDQATVNKTFWLEVQYNICQNTLYWDVHSLKKLFFIESWGYFTSVLWIRTIFDRIRI